jgi:hypothetical protein
MASVDGPFWSRMLSPASYKMVVLYGSNYHVPPVQHRSTTVRSMPGLPYSNMTNRYIAVQYLVLQPILGVLLLSNGILLVPTSNASRFFTGYSSTIVILYSI